MKDLSVKELGGKIIAFGQKLRRYAVVLFVVVLVGMYSFLVFQVNSLADTEPTDEQVSEKLQTVKRPKIDQTAVDRLNQLQGQNVEVQSLFKQARENPFAE